MKRKEPAFVVKRYFPLDLMKPHVRKVVETIIKSIKTGTEARQLVLKKKWKGKWQAKVLDHQGKVIILSYRGIEVALFYKRDTTEYRIEVMDPTPFAPIVDPDNTWVRMEFMHMKPSAKRDTYFLKLKKEVRDKVMHLRGVNKHLNRQVASLEDEVARKDMQVVRLKNKLERLLHPKRRKRR